MTTVTEQSSKGYAIDALRSLLAQVSAIRLKDIRTRLISPATDETMIVVHLDIYGHSHTLVCVAGPIVNGNAALRHALRELCSTADAMTPHATPVVIAPSTSPRARAFCVECGAGYLDLDGNARLELGEYFFLRHCVPVAKTHRSTLPAPAPRPLSRAPVSAAASSQAGAAA